MYVSMALKLCAQKCNAWKGRKRVLLTEKASC